ncbi:MAG: GAF domain-containing protein [Actinobacteria bacterium]|nr:GAF domain-containing protein [Actinomycetota bacterium]
MPDYRTELLRFMRVTRIGLWGLVLMQVLLAMDRLSLAVYLPLTAGLALCYLLFDRLAHMAGESRIRLLVYLFTVLETAFFVAYIVLCRQNPVLSFDFLLMAPVTTLAIWYGFTEGFIAAGVLAAIYLVTLEIINRLTWDQASGATIAPVGLIFLAALFTGFLSRSGERERVEKKRRTLELTALSDFATLFDSTLREEKVLSNLVDAVRRTLDSDVVTVMTMAEDGQSLGPLAILGESPVRMPTDTGVVWQAYSQGKPLLVADTELEPEYVPFCDLPLRCLLYAPMKWRDETYGVLVSGSTEPDAYDHHDMNLLGSMAVQAGLAIHNARLYADLEDRISELHAIFEIDKSITSSIELDVVLEQIVQLSVALIGGKLSSLMLLDEDRGELVIAASQGLSEQYVSKGNIRVGESIAGVVIQEGRPIAVRDIRSDPRHAYPELAAREGLCSMLSVPLLLKDGIIGVLNIYTEKVHDFSQHEINLFTSLASQAAIAIENARLFESLEEIYLEVITALASAIDARDSYTHGHSNRVTEYAVAIAEEMGLPASEVDVIRNASILHDVGKIGIRESILHKPGKLTKDEVREMQYHPYIGYKILQSVKLLEPVLPLVYHHQEHYDGGGYPEGLKGEGIPLGSRIIAVADAFEAMTSDRPYRLARDSEVALQELKDLAGKQFDPIVVDAFLRLVDRGAVELPGQSEEPYPLADIN